MLLTDKYVAIHVGVGGGAGEGGPPQKSASKSSERSEMGNSTYISHSLRNLPYLMLVCFCSKGDPPSKNV